MEDNLIWVKNLIESQLPQSKVVVNDLTGTRDHLDIQITAEAFRGLTMIKQHRLIMDILKDALKDRIHAVKLHTQTP